MPEAKIGEDGQPRSNSEGFREIFSLLVFQWTKHLKPIRFAICKVFPLGWFLKMRNVKKDILQKCYPSFE